MLFWLHYLFVQGRFSKDSILICFRIYLFYFLIVLLIFLLNLNQLIIIIWLWSVYRDINNTEITKIGSSLWLKLLLWLKRMNISILLAFHTRMLLLECSSGATIGKHVHLRLDNWYSLLHLTWTYANISGLILSVEYCLLLQCSSILFRQWEIINIALLLINLIWILLWFTLIIAGHCLAPRWCFFRNTWRAYSVLVLVLEEIMDLVLTLIISYLWL